MLVSKPAADKDDFPKLTSETEYSTNSEIVTNDSEIQPLPWKIFSKEVSDLLSPDIFSQANPFAYLLAKVKKLSRDTWKKMGSNVSLSKVHIGLFPQPYIPYAELASSLISCLCQLHDLKESTQFIEKASQSENLFKPLNMSAMEPELSSLFSPYIFSDNNPPFRLLGELLAMPEKDISNAAFRLENLLEHRLFPRRYSPFTKFLLQFFQSHANSLRSLKCAIAKIQPALEIKSPTRVDQRDADGDSKDDECNLQFHDQTELETVFSGDPDSTLGSQTPQQYVSSFLDRNRAAPTPRHNYFPHEVVEFLSPDMFSQTDPFSYFLNKATKLNCHLVLTTDGYLSYYLDRGRFPQHYIPYAELASSLLSCLMALETVSKDIRYARGRILTYYPPLRFDISTLDPELSALFSTDIMFRATNPSIPLLKALTADIPENEITNVVNRLQNIRKNRRFPQIYGDYNANLCKFLDTRKQRLLRLKDDIAEMQRILMLNSSTPASKQITYIKTL